MEALNRKPTLGVKKTMTLSDGTTIDVVSITARQMMSIANNKRLSDVDKGIHITAARVRINGQAVSADDLLDSFTDTEVEAIIKFASENESEDEEKN